MASPPRPRHSSSNSNLTASSQGPHSGSLSHPADAGDSNGPSLGSQPHPHQQMPTSNSRARSRPLITALGWDLNTIVASSPNFHHVHRVHCTSPAAKPEAVIPHFEEHGLPLIIGGWNRHAQWPKALFNVDWLMKYGDQNPTVRNVHNWVDIKMPLGDFIDKLRHSSVYASADEQERFYGKDGECPQEWTEWLTGLRAIPEAFLFNGSNDFLGFLPDAAKVQTLMCYLGIGDTFTPFHKDLCASSGQNLMCYAEHSGSAFWFMTKSSAAPQVATYFHQLGQELDLETHVVTIEELAKAPFDVYIAEQQLGDLVLVPPRSCHQVVNKGGITIKTSWSRMSLKGLHTALWHELPIYHRVCRPEIYRVRATIFHALRHFTGVLGNSPQPGDNRTLHATVGTLQQLVDLFDDILATEFSASRDSMPHVSQSASSHTDNLHCDFCGADIFQSFFECVPCHTAPSGEPSDSLPIGEGLVLCSSCYVEGRTCRCGVMEPMQCRPYSDLLRIRDQAVRTIESIDNHYKNAYGYLSERPSQLLSGQQVNIFEAACKLSQQRHSESKTSRSCRARREQSHQVPASSAIYCKPCHGSRCYTHLLEANCIHSSDAIILSDRFDGNTDWHLFHSQGAKRYRDSCENAIKDEEMGSRPNASLRLSYLAKTFTTCRAVAPESTEHGWYDRYAQTTLIPITHTPARALMVGLSDELEGDELCDSHRSPITDSPVPAAVGPTPSSSLGTGNSTVGDSSMLAIDGPQGGPSLPRELPSIASISSAPADDPGNLSDLTDLPTDVDSSPCNLTGTSGAGTSNGQTIVNLPLPPLSPSPGPLVALPSTQSLTRQKSKSRVKFAGVEIPRPAWYTSEMRSEMQSQSTSKLKRKRAQTPEVLIDDDTLAEPEQPPRRYPSRQSAAGRREDSNSQTAGPSLLAPSGPPVPSVSSVSSPTRRIATSRPSDKSKRKVSRGAASRTPRLKERPRTSSTILNHSPQVNLTSALNQTFMFNSNAAHTTATPLPNVSISPINNHAIGLPPLKPQYKHAGVGTELHFTRNTSAVAPAEDPFITIRRLQQKQDDLQAECNYWKGKYETCQASLDEINRNFIPPTSQFYPPPAMVLSNTHAPFNCNANTGSSAQHTMANSQPQPMHTDEPDYPPIETLPLLTPSSGESPSQLPERSVIRLSSPTRRRTPTEPRSYRMTRSEREGDHVPYRYGPRRLSRGVDSGESPRNDGKWRGKYSRGPGSSSGNPGRSLASPHQPNHFMPVEDGPPNSPRAAEEKSETRSNVAAPPSPPSTVSDQTRTSL